MAKLILLTGPQAVGKMTVGQELEKITNLKLFHNHMTIDLVSHFFSYGTKTGKKLVETIRTEMLRTIAKSELEGVIFTFVMDYNSEKDKELNKATKEIFEKERRRNLLYRITSTARNKIRKKQNRKS